MSRSRLFSLLAVLGGLAAAGCGGAGVRLSGRLLMNGQPYHLADGERVAVTFAPADPGRPAASATVAPDGSFSVQGEGLQPGAYAISVISTNAKAGGANVYKDKFNGAFSGANSPLKVEIASGSPSLAVDLGAKTVTAK